MARATDFHAEVAWSPLTAFSKGIYRMERKIQMGGGGIQGSGEVSEPEF